MILFYTFCKVIRDRVPPMASNALITYLPKGIKQIYLSGWNGHGLSTTIFSYVDFMDALHESKDKIYGRLFKDKDEANKVLYGIFSTIQSFVSDGQYEKIMASLPLGLRLNLEEDDLFLEGQHLIM